MALGFSKRPRWIEIALLPDGRRIAQNITGEYGVNARNKWRWIKSCIIHEFECGDDDVEIMEMGDPANPYERDVITVNGKAEAFINEYT